MSTTRTKPAEAVAAPKREPSSPLSLRLAGAALVAAAALVFAVIEAFLVPLRVRGPFAVDVGMDGALIPVSAFLAILVNSGLPFLAAWLTEKRAAVLIPGIVWFGVTVPMTMRTSDGDLVISDMWTGYALLLGGAVSVVIAGYIAFTRRP